MRDQQTERCAALERVERVRRRNEKVTKCLEFMLHFFLVVLLGTRGGVEGFLASIPRASFRPSARLGAPRRRQGFWTTARTRLTPLEASEPRVDFLTDKDYPHDKVTDWVIFSDLHLSERSLSTCLSVLQTVHAAAAERNAGIAFLGDWWHVRGTLPVRVLNACLAELTSWTVPVILLPGNHDQVSLGGDVHALTPLSFALRHHPRQCVVIEAPTVFMGALWVPFIRDGDELAGVLKSEAARAATAVFCHAEVTGARMNDGVVVRKGIAPADFPGNSGDHAMARSPGLEDSPVHPDYPAMPLVSGHFHRPHVVRGGGRVVRYVGSPWETSLSEAGEHKALLVYRRGRSNKWVCVASTPISIGPRHFRASTGQHFLDASDGSSDDQGLIFSPRAPPLPSPQVIVPSETLPPSIPSGAPKQGDRVIVAVNGHVSTTALVQIRELRENGVIVELRQASAKDQRGSFLEESMAVDQSIDLTTDGWPLSEATDFAVAAKRENVEQLSPKNLFRAYMKNVLASTEWSPSEEVDDIFFEEQLKNTALGIDGFEKCLELIEEVSAASVASKQEVSDASFIHLESVTIEGFGPFGSPSFSYPLSGRGLVLLRGVNTDGSNFGDGPAGVSNGAGKTALAMAALWGLTGRTDPRPAGSLDASINDVVHRLGTETRAARSKKVRKFAAVSVKGKTRDGEPFVVTRRRGLTGNPKLNVLVGGKDLTEQAVRDTQLAFEKRLGFTPQLLGRCVFFGQHPVGGLLEAPDVALKDELSAVVPLNVWADAQALAKAYLKKSKENVSKLVAQRQIRGPELIQSQQAATAAAQASDSTKMLISQEIQELDHQDEIEEVQGDLHGNQSQSVRSVSTKVKMSMASKVESANVAVERAMVIATRADERSRNAAVEARRASGFASQSRTQVVNEASALGNSISEVRIVVPLADNASSWSLIEENSQQFISLAIKGKVDEATLQQEGLRNALDVVALTASSSVNHCETTAISKLRVTAEARSRLQVAREALEASLVAEIIPEGLSTEDEDSIENVEKLRCGACGQSLLPGHLEAHRNALKKAEVECVAAVSEAEAEEKAAELNVREAVRAEVAIRNAIDSLNTLTAAAIDYSLRTSAQRLAERDAAAEAKVAQEAAAAATAAGRELREIRAAAERALAEEVWGRQQEQARQAAKKWRAERRLRLTFELSSVEGAAEASSARAASARAALSALDGELDSSERSVELYSAAVDLFGPRGAPAFVLAGAVAELEQIAHGYLLHLSGGALALRIDLEGEKIRRRVLVRLSDGTFTERALGQLSGGQWRRAALALSLAFTELAKRRGRLECNILVLDEIMTHLDAHGRERVASLLRSLTAPREQQLETKQVDAESGSRDFAASKKNSQQSSSTGGGFETIILILQDSVAAELEESFDAIDTITKIGDTSSASIDSGI